MGVLEEKLENEKDPAQLRKIRRGYMDLHGDFPLTHLLNPTQVSGPLACSDNKYFNRYANYWNCSPARILLASLFGENLFVSEIVIRFGFYLNLNSDNLNLKRFLLGVWSWIGITIWLLLDLNLNFDLVLKVRA